MTAILIHLQFKQYWSARHHTQVGRRSDLQTEEFTRQMPIGKMQDPIHRAPSFEFAVPKPCSNGQKQAYDNMLRQNSPGERDHQNEEFIKRPEPDKFGIVEMLWDGILVQRSSPPERFAAIPMRVMEQRPRSR